MKSVSKLYQEALTHLNINNKKVLCAFSGGVDSLVAAMLTAKVIGRDNLYCLFIDHGLIRFQDDKHIDLLKKNTNLNIKKIDASEVFLKKLKGVKDPEKKRKIIGKTFIQIFEREVKRLEKEDGINFEYLLQGTIAPDIIESSSLSKGKKIVIKSHHNVGGLPKRMKLKLLEPLQTFFKDDVRKLGHFLKLKEEWLYRHPFPGPGLGVRIVGDIDKSKLKIAKLADQILFEELLKFKLYTKIWQAFFIYLPIKTVGIKKGKRVDEDVLVLRLVNSKDAMTATWVDVDRNFLEKVVSRITTEVAGITKVLFDITNKPPATIEWE